MAIKGKAKKGRKPVPENESKGDRFRRLAQGRVVKLISGLRSLGKLSAPQYERTEGQITAIKEALQNELDEAISKLSRTEKSVEKSATFEFPS